MLSYFPCRASLSLLLQCIVVIASFKGSAVFVAPPRPCAFVVSRHVIDRLSLLLAVAAAAAAVATAVCAACIMPCAEM